MHTRRTLIRTAALRCASACLLALSRVCKLTPFTALNCTIACCAVCCVLACRYPAFAGGLLSNWQLVEGMKESFCYSAQDYGGLLQKAAAEPSTAGEESFAALLYNFLGF